MVRRLAILCLAWVSLALPGQAQERSFISGDDTLHYVYTPLPVDSTAAAGDARQRRDPFFRRLVKYFEGSNVDRTFEKKIDFTFAGGPSYSKTTSLGIGLLAAGLYRLDRTDSVTAPSDVALRQRLHLGCLRRGCHGQHDLLAGSPAADLYGDVLLDAP